ncbi:MAG: discoidin domain-containing protein, partial [Acidimicrobiales bacterium]
RPRPNVAPARYRLVDEEALSLLPSSPWPPPVAVFKVAHPRPVYRSEPASSPLVLDGSGTGLVAAAASGLLAGDPTIFYAGTLDKSRRLLKEATPPGAVLVLTDSDRKDLRRWSSVSDNIGETLTAARSPTNPDPTAQPLEVFGHQPSSAESVAGYRQARWISASGYGNPVAYTPEDRPYMAFDGSTATAWSVAAFSRAAGSWLSIALKAPVTTDRVNLVQVLAGLPNRFITKVTLRFDGRRPITARLAGASRRRGGEDVFFSRRTFRTLSIRIDGTTWRSGNLTGASGVGFSEVRIPGVQSFETIVMPRDLLGHLAKASLSHRLVVLMSRQRVAPFPPRSDPETVLSRSFYLPTPRSFSIGGTARISALIADNKIDTLLGGPKVFGGAVIGSNERLPGDLDARAVFALDKSSSTFWGPGFDAPAQRKAWMEISLRHSISFHHLDLQVVADGRHSVPRLLKISTNSGDRRLLRIPPVTDRTRPGATVTIPLSFKAVSGSVIRFRVEAV